MTRNQVSDEKYVEQVRKRDRTLRRMWWVWPILLVAMLYCLVRYVGLVQKITADLPFDRRMVYTGLLLGVSFGFMLSMIALQAGLCIKQWIDARHGFRTERLMLTYHDELMKRTPNQASHATSETAPSAASSAHEG